MAETKLSDDLLEEIWAYIADGTRWVRKSALEDWHTRVSRLEQTVDNLCAANEQANTLLGAEIERRELAEARLALVKSLPMTVHDAPEVTSADLLAYLDARGYEQERPAWEREGVEIMRFYQKPGVEGVVQVPMADGYDDFKSRVYDFFRAVASVEYGDERKQLLVWLELYDIHADALRKDGEQA